MLINYILYIRKNVSIESYVENSEKAFPKIRGGYNNTVDCKRLINKIIKVY